MLSASLEICVPLLVLCSNQICGTSCTTDSVPPAQPHHKDPVDPVDPVEPMEPVDPVDPVDAAMVRDRDFFASEYSLRILRRTSRRSSTRSRRNDGGSRRTKGGRRARATSSRTAARRTRGTASNCALFARCVTKGYIYLFFYYCNVIVM